MQSPATAQADPNRTEQRIRRALDLRRGLENRRAQSLFDNLYPETDHVWTGPSLMGGLVEPGQTLYSRDKYPKHMEWLAAGAKYRERCAMMANRTGKTFGLGGYEMACHLTGLYPPWWEGRRFTHPVSAWAAGDTYETTRDILQLVLLGNIAYRGNVKTLDGRGIIPGYCLGRNTWHGGVPDTVDTILIKHFTPQSVCDGHSFLGFKSYDQGRRKFQGTARHVIWFDEEPPLAVYNEALIRTATVNGIVMLTFTPLLGLSEVVLSFLPAEQRPS